MRLTAGESTTCFFFALLFTASALAQSPDAPDFKETKRLAEQGNAQAQFNLAFMYNNGQGISKNYGLAVELYRKAAMISDSA